MAEWNKGKVLPSAINGGKEFTESDNLALDELNAIVNNSFYAAELVENSIAEVNNATAQGKAELELAVEQGMSELDAVAAQSKSELNDIVVDASELVEDAKNHIDTVVETANRAEETANLAEEKIDAFIKTEGNSVVTIGGVPQTAWSADFAESEKKKSTNLFDLSKVDFISSDVTVDFANNSFTFTGGNCWTKNNLRDFIDVQEGEVVYLSGNTTFFEDGIIVGDGERWGFNTAGRVSPMDLDNPVSFMGDPSSSTTISNLQFEKYEITDYQSYHGQVTHNGDAPVVFAESEWQKSKNLFKVETASTVSGDITYTADDNTQTITINGTTTQSYTRIAASGYEALEAGKTYAISGDFTSIQAIAVYLHFTDGTFETMIIQGGRKKITFTPNQQKVINGLAIEMYNKTFYNAVLRIQVEQGNVATDWQYPYGAIVHEKDIADVEHVETIYDYASTDTNKNWGYSNGLKGGTTIENVNFSKYKKVKIYCTWFNAALQPIVIDFSVVTDASVVGNAIYKNDTDTHSITCSIQDKNKFKVNACYSYNSGTPVLENTDYFVVKKIEGVY